ncbi:MAG: SMC-Scp complex subunit ScpB [Sphingomonadaceae bacterium]|nr:SMC-Scp complex subunit ScpB [Sphingomonadaceae bacterium]
MKAADIRAVEALLFASAVPLSDAELAERLPDADVRACLAAIEERHRGGGFELTRSVEGWSFRTAPDLAPLLTTMRDAPRPLGRAAMETLAIIAYHEPVSRAEIEEIRGVATPEGALRQLLEAGWVRTAGRRESPGRPMQFATTPAFLDQFGLSSRRDLPNLSELKAAGLLSADMPAA